MAFPVAHHDGNYQADAATLDRLEGEGRVAFRYLERCNGSARDIAGILNDAGNVLGLMPHPERAWKPRTAAPTAAACSKDCWRPSSSRAACSDRRLRCSRWSTAAPCTSARGPARACR